MNFCNAETGQWEPSIEEIDALPGGAAATNGDYQVYFPANIYDGVIKMVTPHHLTLTSQPLGISYDDGTNTVLIAELTNSIGQLISPNQIIYTNAFVGVSADLLYTYKKGGFEQDVIFRGEPPPPADFGLRSASTRLQMVTEFFNPPEPVQTSGRTERKYGLRDTTLTFGAMKMMEGRAFLTSGSPSRTNIQDIAVFKQWLDVGGRHLLIEEVPFENVQTELSGLSSMRTAPMKSGTVLGRLSAIRLLPPVHLARTGAKSPQIARADMPRKSGFELDYLAVNSSETNFTFRGDSTYFVDGALDLFGTTVIEGGTVVKFTNSANSEIFVNGPIVCQTTSYATAIFTAKDDDSVGVAIAGSTGTPSGYYADPALSCNDDPLFLHDMVIKHHCHPIKTC